MVDIISDIEDLYHPLIVQRVNSLLMQVQYASSLTDGILLFFSGINCQKSDVKFLFKFWLSLWFRFQIMAKIKPTKASKIQFVFKTSPQNLWKVPSANNISICAALRFLATNAFLLKVIKIRPNTKRTIGSRSKLLIPHTSQTFLRSNNTNFVEKVTKDFCLMIFLCTSWTTRISKTYFMILVTICHLKLLVGKQCCN